MKRLKDKCKLQYRIWKLRSAKKSFDEALARKWLTAGECVLLLTEFAHEFVEVNGVEIVKGVLPVSLAEAEECLKLKIEGPMPCNETPIQHYLSHRCRHRSHRCCHPSRKRGECRQYSEGEGPDDLTRHDSNEDIDNSHEGTDDDFTCNGVEELHDLSSALHDIFQFYVGDGVVVDVDGASINGDEYDSISGHGCSTLVLRRSQTASVVFMTATLCFVHFDGESTRSLVPVPVDRCSLLDENNDDENANSSQKGVAHIISFESTDGDADFEENEVAPTHAPQRPRTVEEALVEGSWKLVRKKNHIRYNRYIKLPLDRVKKETLTFSKTSSDWRAKRNALALIRCLSNGSRVEEEPVPVAQHSIKTKSTKFCPACGKRKPANYFSKNQLKKGLKRKCMVCVEG